MSALLKACPFCGSADRPAVMPYTGEPYIPGFVVCCSASGFDGQPGRGCGSCTGWHETPTEAAKAWNGRSLDADIAERKRCANIVLQYFAPSQGESMHPAAIEALIAMRETPLDRKNPSD
jgi:hypothetical protein